MYLQLVRCRCAYDEASQEDNKDAIDDEIQVVEVTTKAIPFMPEQRSHEGVSQQILSLISHLKGKYQGTYII